MTLTTPVKKWAFSADTETPPGGVIVRKPGTNEPYGLIMEMAYLPVFASLPQTTAEQEIEWSRAGQMLYAQHGVTTAHEGGSRDPRQKPFKSGPDVDQGHQGGRNRQRRGNDLSSICDLNVGAERLPFGVPP